MGVQVDVDRLIKISTKIEVSGRKFRTFNENVGAQLYYELADEFVYLVTILNALNLDISLFLKLIEGANSSLEKKDYVGVADTLSYEINPVLQELINYFKGI